MVSKGTFIPNYIYIPLLQNNVVETRSRRKSLTKQHNKRPPLPEMNQRPTKNDAELGLGSVKPCLMFVVLSWHQ